MEQRGMLTQTHIEQMHTDITQATVNEHKRQWKQQDHSIWQMIFHLYIQFFTLPTNSKNTAKANKQNSSQH